MSNDTLSKVPINPIIQFIVKITYGGLLQQKRNFKPYLSGLTSHLTTH
jgi:hypothetical protein